ncbi:hypothetical protein [Nocardioides ochotonae]|uniref:hypothetical protein n=1 Tax=Nocardioides ochotonae TaxID=2685869 RepID=UPI00140A52DE|nr:hypothetical protein [Nocardioides ochotonae]
MSSRPLVTLGLTLVVVLGALAWLLLRAGSTAEITGAADRFTPAPEWTLAEEIIEPPRLMCIGASVPCPSVHRRYESAALLSAAQLERLGADAGAEDWTLSGTCQPDATTTGTYTVCTGEGTIGAYVVTVSQAVHADAAAAGQGPGRLVVSVEKA